MVEIVMKHSVINQDKVDLMLVEVLLLKEVE